MGQPMPRLTKTRIDKLKPNPERETFAWCTDPRRFGLRISPTGRKTFIIQYGQDGRTRRYAIGTFGRLTVDQARAHAKELFAEIAKGADPSRDRKARRRASTVSELADRYLEEHARVHKRPSSIRSDEGLIRKHVKPRLGRFRVGELTRQDLAEFHRALRSRPIAANRCLALLGKMLSCAQLWGMRDDNPVRGIPRYKEKRRSRFLSESEFSNLGAALRSTEIKSIEDPFVIAAIRLLACSGFRLGEILSLHWCDVDMERARVMLRDAKAGDRLAIANPAMLTLFSGLLERREAAIANHRRLDRKPRESSPFVIPGRIHGKPLVGIHRPWARICAKAKLDDLRIHDLRHSFASLGAAGGLSLPAIGALLGHRSPQTTDRYVDWADAPLRQASERVGGRILAAMDADSEEFARVIPLSPIDRHP